MLGVIYIFKVIMSVTSDAQDVACVNSSPPATQLSRPSIPTHDALTYTVAGGRLSHVEEVSQTVLVCPPLS